MSDIKEIINFMKFSTKADTELVERAFDFAEKAHTGQMRFSGEPYFVHVFETAKILARIGMSSTVIAAGLLHDVLEDTDTKREEFEKEFGEEILFLVDGVTKLGKLKYRGLKRHTESLRKLFIATAQDIRVLIIKLADRLHNMRTLQYVPKEKQIRIASETLEIFAPLAYRLGMRILHREIEDIAFSYVYPKEYKTITDLLKRSRKKEMERIEKFDRSVKKALASQGMTQLKTSYRIKGLYSLYKKLQRKDMDVGKVYDIYALRLIVPTNTDCYKALGIIHSVWRPLPGRIKDYIAFPKPNGYQSLHTTIFTGDGSIIEVQIRTEKMHNEAEYGIASHLSYKYKNNEDNTSRSHLLWIKKFLPNIEKLNRENKDKERSEYEDKDIPQWVKQLAERADQIGSKEFMENLRKDFFEERIFVFTPKGEVVDLPIDSSPIDFAYTIHSDIGDHISGAKVDNKLVSLDTRLKNGDIVEIITRESNKPTRKWMEFAKTTEARRHIKNWLNKQKN